MEAFREGSATGLFFRGFLTHPGRVAALLPSSPVLSRLIADRIRRADDEYVVELGAGTGSVTQAMLASGIPADRLIVVEIDKEMAGFLRGAYPDVTVLGCSAFEIEQSLPQAAIGKAGSVVCGIPIALLPLEQQRRLVAIMLSLMPPGRCFLVLTYRWASPLPARKLGLVGRRIGFTPRNLPPASVWAYAADAAALP